MELAPAVLSIEQLAPTTPNTLAVFKVAFANNIKEFWLLLSFNDTLLVAPKIMVPVTVIDVLVAFFPFNVIVTPLLIVIEPNTCIVIPLPDEAPDPNIVFAPKVPLIATGILKTSPLVVKFAAAVPPPPARVFQLAGVCALPAPAAVKK